jgi:hypothetical protein
MNRSPFRPQLTQLEDRCTPFSFSAWIGSGPSAVRLLVDVQIPQEPFRTELVSITKFLPNGDTVAIPVEPTRIATNALTADIPMHDLFGPGAVRGLLEAAHVNSSLFIPPHGDDGGGHG